MKSSMVSTNPSSRLVSLNDNINTVSIVYSHAGNQSYNSNNEEFCDNTTVYGRNNKNIDDWRKRCNWWNSTCNWIACIKIWNEYYCCNIIPCENVNSMLQVFRPYKREKETNNCIACLVFGFSNFLLLFCWWLYFWFFCSFGLFAYRCTSVIHISF